MKPCTLSSRLRTDAAILAGLSLTLSLHAGDVIKLNNADSLNLGSSWTGNNPPGVGDVGVWDSTVTGANTTSLGGALSWSGIRIANPGGAVAINAGDSLTLGSAGIDMSAATQNLTLGNAVTLGAAQAWNVASGRTLLTTGAIDGNAGLTKSGAGTLTLSGANTSTGSITVSAGTLKGGAAHALGSTTPAAGTSVTAGATLDLGGFAQTTGSLSGAGIVTSSAAAGALTLGGDNATANFTGTLNSGNITTVNKTGTGTQTLTGAGFWSTANTTSQYNVLDGTLTMDATGVANVANILGGGWAVSSGKTFNLSYNTAASTLLLRTGALSGAGTVNLSGAGCIDFWSPSAGTSARLDGFTGQLNIGCSSLSIQTDTIAKATTTASVNISPGKFLDLRTMGFQCDKLTGTGIVADSHSAGGFGTLTVGTANGSSQFDGTIKDTDTSMIGYAAGGGIALTKTGTGTLTLAGPITYSGATTINNGTLVVSNAAGWASNVSFSASNSPKLQIDTPLAADAWNFTKVISGANTNATFEKTGPGSVTITAAQTYTGATTVTAGALRLQSTEYSTAFPTIPGMKVWLDAADPEADGNTTTPTAGAAINTWKNKGTLGASGDFTAVQTGNAPTYTASVAAFNNKPTITFNAATGKQLANTTNFTNTLSVVYVGRIGATKQRLVSGGTVNWILGYWNNNMNVNYWNGGSLGTAADTNPHIWINGATGGANPLGYRFDAAGETLLGNGSSTGPTAGLMLGGGWVGGEKSDGDIAELFVFDHQLTAAERVQLEGYLYNKYFGSQFPPIVTSLNSTSPVSVASGATFGGFGSAGNISVSGGGTLEGGHSGVGSLTANNVTLSGAATLKGSLSTAPGSRALTVSNLAINGGDESLLINPGGTGLSAGTYDLVVSTNPITAPGATSVQATLKSASRQYTPIVDGTGTKIQMIYDPNASVYWTGAAGSAWDISATSWKVSGDNSDTQFRANDVVFFHDSPASNVVDISGADVNPASTVFDNTSATAYALQGTHGISTGTITKANDGSLTIANPNNTSGAVALNGGTVTLAQTGILGTGNLSFGGGHLSYSGTGATWNRAIALNAPATIGVTDSSATFTQSGALSGTGSLTKSGAGTLALTGPSSYVGGTTISGGTLQFGNGTANVATGGTYAISSGTLYLNNATAAAPAWASFSGAGTLRLNSAQAINGSANWGTAALGVGFTGTLQLDKGRVDAAPAALGGATNVAIGNGAQFLAYNNTTNSYTFPQDFSISGMGWGEGGLNFGALRVSTMNATFTGDITLTGDSGLLLQSPAGGVMTVSGDISGSQNLSIYNDRGTAAAITLSGAKSYSGATTLSRGLLSVDTLANGGTASSIGASSNAAANLVLSTTAASTLRYTGATASTDRNFTLTAASSSTIDISSSGTTLTLTGGSANTTGALTKSGTGTLALDGSNQHTGTTTVSAGTLLVNGSTHASSALGVSASATLGGTGTVGGTATVNSNGTLAPGSTGTGILSTGAVTLTSGTYACQIDGANSDRLAASGTLTLTGATLAISTLTSPTASSYVIATFTGATPTFTTVTGLPAGYVVDTGTAGLIKLVGNPVYATWAASKGLTAANNGKQANPDGDASDNLMEFAFGTDPLVPSGGVITYADGTVTAPGAPTISITNNGNSVDFRAIFGRRQDYLAAGLVYTVQFSADLIEWVDSTATPSVVATGTEIDAVSVPYPLFIPTTRGVEKPSYFRVSVTEAP